MKHWKRLIALTLLLLLTLTAASGEVLEVIPYDIGFRRFELKDGIMLLNGQRLVIHGVNRHEWNPSAGMLFRCPLLRHLRHRHFF